MLSTDVKLIFTPWLQVMVQMMSTWSKQLISALGYLVRKACRSELRSLAFKMLFMFFLLLTLTNISWLFFIMWRRSWQVILLYLASNTWKNFSWFMDTGAILDWPTWSFTSSIRMWWALHLHWSALLSESTLFSSTHVQLMCLSGVREPAVLVPVLLWLLRHCHDRLLADDFLQPLLHLYAAHHVWDNGQRFFSRDAAGCSWTVQERTGCRGQCKVP